MSEKETIYWLECVDSTQLELKRKLQENPDMAHLSAVVADSQDNGRGRGVSKWHDVKGNSVLLSVFVRNEGPKNTNLLLLQRDNNKKHKTISQSFHRHGEEKTKQQQQVVDHYQRVQNGFTRTHSSVGRISGTSFAVSQEETKISSIVVGSLCCICC